MDSAGGNRRPLTAVAGDNRPAWSPDGRSVVFTSDGRDGNAEIYRADVATGQVTRLTDSPGLDVNPSVDPDSEWVAFLSNRDGAWKLWVVPLVGGPAQLLAPLRGEVGDWNTQGVQWVY
jgi:Tol biopolymer transport system component